MIVEDFFVAKGVIADRKKLEIFSFNNPKNQAMNNEFTERFLRFSVVFFA